MHFNYFRGWWTRRFFLGLVGEHGELEIPGEKIKLL